jgi:hypothetical protein
MRWYWAKIILGALAIFVVGYLGVSAVRRSVSTVRQLSETSDPISIPLAFIPFHLDGERAGTFSGLRIMRETPKSLVAFHIRVKLGDSVDVEHLKQCRLYLEQTGTDFDPDDEFECIGRGESDSGLVQFGDVTFTRDGLEFSVPLLLSEVTVHELRHVSDAEAVTARAVAEAEAAAAVAEANAEVAREVARVKIDVRKQVEAAKRQARDAKPPPAEPRP